MPFTVIEHFRGREPKATHRRVREKGRVMPGGLRFVGGWVAADMGRCFRRVAADEVALLWSRVARWRDLAGFESVPVTPGKNTVEVLDGRL